MQSEFTFIKFCAELCAEIVKKNIYDLNKLGQIVPKVLKSGFFASFAFGILNFAQILENVAQTCVSVSVRFRSSDSLVPCSQSFLHQFYTKCGSNINFIMYSKSCSALVLTTVSLGRSGLQGLLHLPVGLLHL